MKRVVLVRHGETEWNREGRMQGHADIPLNASGRAQSAAVAARFLGERFDALWCSDLVRARETADAIGRTVGVVPRPSALWRELEVGELEGVQHFSFGARLRELMEHPDPLDQPLTPGGESLGAFQRRLRDGWDRIEGENALVVSHGGAIKCLLVDLLRIGPHGIDSFSLRHNTGVTVVEIMNGYPRIVLLNCAAHLR
ncbi:MAG: histidine phosphatase family protein [Planctomycetota bacterium]|nr:histidine phosphatase family protein [Planctomycetota bacterium]